eukprot:Nk52_evm1s1375 gene=Nk52_evmTU1s1375
MLPAYLNVIMLLAVMFVGTSRLFTLFASEVNYSNSDEMVASDNRGRRMWIALLVVLALAATEVKAVLVSHPHYLTVGEEDLFGGQKDKEDHLLNISHGNSSFLMALYHFKHYSTLPLPIQCTLLILSITSPSSFTPHEAVCIMRQIIVVLVLCIAAWEWLPS